MDQNKKERIELKEENYVKKVLLDIWDDLPLWILADLVFVVFCSPTLALLLADLRAPSLLSAIITFPAFAGINYCAGKTAKGEAAGPRDLLIGIRKFLGRSLILGAVAIFLVFISASTYQIIRANPDQRWLIFPWALQLSALIFWGALNIYAFGVMTLYDADLRTTLSCSLLLAVKHKMPTLGMLSLLALMALLARLAWIGLILVFPAVFAVLASNLTLLLVKKHQAIDRD
ncbi:MAG: hypothetical protein ACUVXI_19320 [bacterium]